MREALVARGYTIQEAPEDLYFDIAAERNGMVEFFVVDEDQENVWNSREDYEPATVTFRPQTEDVRGESFWYVIVCRATKSFIIAQSTSIFLEENITEGGYTLPNEKCFIINYNEFINAPQ